MRAWIKHEGRLQLRETPDPIPRSNELLVRVEAFSLNRGELRTAALAADGTIPGWDVAGTVVATVPGGPPIGTRVAAMTSGGAWAELAAVPVHTTAAMPEGLSISIAATLPLAGLTVMRALAMAGPLLGKRALVTGQRGGVGMLAMQLIPFSGADVVGCRSAADVTGDYDFILESAGGDSFTAAIDRIAPRGTIVTIGNSSEQDSTINVRNLYRKGAVTDLRPDHLRRSRAAPHRHPRAAFPPRFRSTRLPAGRDRPRARLAGPGAGAPGARTAEIRRQGLAARAVSSRGSGLSSGLCRLPLTARSD